MHQSIAKQRDHHLELSEAGRAEQGVQGMVAGDTSRSAKRWRPSPCLLRVCHGLCTAALYGFAYDIYSR